MSHIVQIQTEIRDPVAVESACARLGLPAPTLRCVALFISQATGLAVQLPDWRYPIVCQTESGKIQYDNYGGRWGEQRHLDRLLQLYAVEKAKSEARKLGYSVTEQHLEDGSIKVQILAGA